MMTKTDEAEDYSVIVESKHLVSTSVFSESLQNMVHYMDGWMDDTLHGDYYTFENGCILLRVTDVSSF